MGRTGRAIRAGTTQYQYDKIVSTIKNINSESNIIQLNRDEINSISINVEKINKYDEQSVDKIRDMYSSEQFMVIDNLNAEILAVVGIIRIISSLGYGTPFTFQTLNDNEDILKEMF